MDGLLALCGIISRANTKGLGEQYQNNIIKEITQFSSYTRKVSYVLHFLGSWYPSRPGLTGMLGIVVWQERHCTVSVRALAFTPEAATTIPATFTNRLTSSD